MTKPLLAYLVQSDYDGEGGIYFAATRIEATRDGADEHNDGELRGLRVRREPWADKYAPGPVPKLDMIDNGWWFECNGCLCRIDSDMEVDVHDDDGGETRALDPVERGDAIYCTAACMERRDQEKLERKARETEVREYMRALVLHALPGVTLGADSHVYVRHNDAGDLAVEQAYISFRFPGCAIADAHYRYDGPDQRRRGEDGDQPYVTVCAGDKDAWNAWRDQVKAAA